jgi:hypothetical protein
MSNTGRFKRTGKTGRWPIPTAARDTAKPARPETKATQTKPTETKPAGRITHDERGNAVWKFGNDTARTAGASTILRRLDVPDLQVEGQASEPPARPKSPAKSPAKRKETPKLDEGGGYNPYDAPAKRPPKRGR